MGTLCRYNSCTVCFQFTRAPVWNLVTELVVLKWYSYWGNSWVYELLPKDITVLLTTKSIGQEMGY